MAEPMQVALLALALSASMPCEVREIDTGRVIETVAEYMDTTIGPMAAYGIAPIIEEPGEGQVLALLWLPDDATGVAVLPAAASSEPVASGACGQFITWGN